MAVPVTGRFAPTPSGRLHLGNLLCALLAYLSVRKQEGRFLLRIEDLDVPRCPRRLALQAIEDLEWFGFRWDETPLFQSERSTIYQQHLEQLKRKGLIYPCFCTRAQLLAASAPHRGDGLKAYPGTCRDLTEAERAVRRTVRAPALRLRVPDENLTFTDGHMGLVTESLSRDCGDFLLRRSDGLFAYQLAVVVDDAAMGVTEVVRGADLLDSTPRQMYLYQLLGLKAPEFIHLPLLLTEEGRRLSKRDGDLDLGALRAAGVAPERILGRLAHAVGLAEACEDMSAEDLVGRFSWDTIGRHRQDIVVGRDFLG